MTANAYRYRFPPGPPMSELRDSLMLAILACEALHGDTPVRLEVKYEVDAKRRECVVSSDSEPGRDLNRVFTGLLTKEFGADSFTVEPIDTALIQRPGAKHHRPSRVRMATTK